MPILDIPFSFIIVLLYGIDMQDNDVFHYLAIKEGEIEKFVQTARSGEPYDLKDYGVVLQSGYGEPDDEVKVKMTNLYGCNHKSIITIS